MKKRIMAMVLTMVMIMGAVIVKTDMPAGASGETRPRIVVNGNVINTEGADPFIDNNNFTMVPVRFVAEELGAVVGWDGERQQATLTRGDTTVQLTIGQVIIRINGITMPPMATRAILREGRTYVPLRFVAQAFGAEVRWDGATRTAYIDLEDGHVVKLEETEETEKPEGPKQPMQPDASMVDRHGLLLPAYSEPILQELFDSIKFVWEDGTPYFHYTVPEGLPEDTWFFISLRTQRNDSSPIGVPIWFHDTVESVAGHREAGRDYLLPFEGVVRHPLPQIPLEYTSHISISIALIRPLGAIDGATELAAQRTFVVYILPNELQNSFIRKFTLDTFGREIVRREYVYFDAADKMMLN